MGEANDDNWEMPKPVFRSTTGSLPKSFEETISQSFSPDTDTVEIDQDDDILGVMDPSIARPPEKTIDAERVDLASHPAPENVVRAKAESSPPKRRGMSMAIIFLLIAVAAAAIAAAYYFGKTNNE
jgi:hypothetical protein